MSVTEFTKAQPEYVTVSLTDCMIIAISGHDAEKFLQGQLSCDLAQLGADNWLYGSHCDNKGKALSIFYLTRFRDQLLLITTAAAGAASLAQLQKFAVFSQAEISDVTDQYHCYGLFGSAAPAQLADMLGHSFVSEAAQPVFSTAEDIALQIGEQPSQYLLLSEQLEIPVNSDEQLWWALEIERGRATLQQQTILEFVPQMLNVQALNGISFTKGCYIGQETIARMKYLGKQKRALYRLVGTGSEVAPGATLEQQLGDNWRRAGTVINAVSRAQHQLELLAVLPSDLDSTVRLRVKDDDASLLEIYPLPYNLDES